MSKNNQYAVETFSLTKIFSDLWGRAKEYYEASIQISPSADAYGELSRLLKSLGEHDASDAYLKNYGDLIGAELPELPMPGNPILSQTQH